jgi:hypothetical protein
VETELGDTCPDDKCAWAIGGDRLIHARQSSEVAWLLERQLFPNQKGATHEVRSEQ